MNSSHNFARRCLSLLIALLMPVMAVVLPISLRAEGPAAAISKPIIDVGLVVSDLDKSAAFYTNVIGLHEVPGFAVPAELGRKIGLTDSRPVKSASSPWARETNPRSSS
jgi:hypothetical protein